MAPVGPPGPMPRRRQPRREDVAGVGQQEAEVGGGPFGRGGGHADSIARLFRCKIISQQTNCPGDQAAGGHLAWWTVTHEGRFGDHMTSDGGVLARPPPPPICLPCSRTRSCGRPTPPHPQLTPTPALPPPPPL